MHSNARSMRTSCHGICRNLPGGSLPVFLRAALPLVLCLCLAACFPVMRSSHPQVYGVVTDAVTGEPLEGALVTYVSMGDITAVTDAGGRFRLPGRNFMELTFPGNEAPPLRAELRADRAGYCPGKVSGFSRFGGSRPDVQYEMNIHLLPESHRIVPYAAALKQSVAEGGGYEQWLGVLRNMQRAGIPREEAVLMLDVFPDIFTGLPHMREAERNAERLRQEILGGSGVWPIGISVPQNPAGLSTDSQD